MSGEYEIRIEPSRKRVRVEFNGARIADSARALVLHETRLPPAYYFPAEDVRMESLARTGHTTHCPFKGTASYWSVKVGDQVVIRIGYGGNVWYRLTKLVAVDHTRQRRLVVEPSSEYGASFYRSGKNCFHPMGQKNLIQPTPAVVAAATERNVYKL